MTRVPHHLNRSGTGMVIFGLAASAAAVSGPLYPGPSLPTGLPADDARIGDLFVQCGHPLVNLGQHLAGLAAAQFAPGAVTGAVFGEFQVFQQFVNAGTIHFGGRHQRARRVRNAVNAAVRRGRAGDRGRCAACGRSGCYASR